MNRLTAFTWKHLSWQALLQAKIWSVMNTIRKEEKLISFFKWERSSVNSHVPSSWRSHIKLELCVWDHEVLVLIIKFRNWGPDKANDLVSLPQRTGSSRSSYSVSCSLSLSFKGSPPGSLKLLQEMQEGICTFGFVQFVYMYTDRTSCYHIYVCNVWHKPCLLSWDRDPLD